MVRWMASFRSLKCIRKTWKVSTDNSLSTRVLLRSFKLSLTDGLTLMMLKLRISRNFCRRKRTSSPWTTGFSASNHGVSPLIRLPKLARFQCQVTCITKLPLVRKELPRPLKLSYMIPLTCPKLTTSISRTTKCFRSMLKFALSSKMLLNSRREIF